MFNRKIVRSYDQFKNLMEASGHTLTYDSWYDRVIEPHNLGFIIESIGEDFCRSLYENHLGLLSIFESRLRPQAFILLRDRYLADYEYPSERFFFAVLRISTWDGENQVSRELGHCLDMLKAVMEFHISLATPILLNILKAKPSLASCFIMDVEDSLEGIMKALTDAARISKAGGGVGVNLSNIRAHGSSLAGVAGGASGVIPAVKLFNDTAVFFNQGGKRAGAFTCALGVWHLDIYEFLELQTEHGDPRCKAYDIFPQVVIPNLFMEAVESNGDWYLFDPKELRDREIYLCGEPPHKFNKYYKQACAFADSGRIKNFRIVRAKDLFIVILKTQVETGLPYLFFRDTVNNACQLFNYPIECSNLCVESYSPFSTYFYHVCSLTSINLAYLNTINEIREAARQSFNVLEGSRRIQSLPVPEAEAHSDNYRVFGIGLMGVADYFAKNKLSNYVSNPEAKARMGLILEAISLTALQSSVNFSKTHKVFIEESTYYQEGFLVNRNSLESYEGSPFYDEWKALRDDLESGFLHNLQLMAIAPNSSTSLLMGVTPSIFPAYSEFYYDRGTSMNAIQILYPEYRDYYTFAADVTSEEIIDFVAICQKHVDSGISMELMFDFANKSISAKTIYDAIMRAWKSGIKTIYYIRSNTNQSCSVDQSSCNSCAN